MHWLGLGSNLLVRDGGIRGAVIATGGLPRELERLDERRVRASAGLACMLLAKRCVRWQLGPAAFFAGIPGTVGGALAMNAGAFGGETWTNVESVTTIDRRGELHERPRAEFEIDYRSVRGPANEWFLGATFRFEHDASSSMDAIKELLARRNAAQPLGVPSCGSVFRNPPGDFAGRLIEQAGLKGRRFGGAMVSDKHANFILNVRSRDGRRHRGADRRGACGRRAHERRAARARGPRDRRSRRRERRGSALMFGRKANRRRVESRVARLKLPTLGAVWLRRLRAALVLPLMAVAFYGVFKGVQLVLDQPVRNLVVEGTFQRVTPIQVEAAVADGLNAGFMTVESRRVARASAGARLGRSRQRRPALARHVDRARHRAPSRGALGRERAPERARRAVHRALAALRSRSCRVSRVRPAPSATSRAAISPCAASSRRPALSLERLELDERGAWRLVLGGGQEIRLGRRDIDERLYRFFDVVAPALAAELQPRRVRGFALHERFRRRLARRTAGESRGRRRGTGSWLEE